jgi:hypothetical protein
MPQKMNKINAKQIKPFLIDFLLQKKKSKYDLLVNEAPFLRGNRWADLLAIKKDNLIGFEIKSEADTFKKNIKSNIGLSESI